MCVGKKGYEHFFKRDYTIINHYKDFWMNLDYNQAMQIGNDVSNAFINQNICAVRVIYNYFKTVGSQEVIFEQFLPMTLDNDISNIKKDII